MLRREPSWRIALKDEQGDAGSENRRQGVGEVHHSQECGTARIGFTLGADKDWRTMRLPLKCLDPKLAGISLAAAAQFTLELQSLRVIPQAGDDGCVGPF